MDQHFDAFISYRHTERDIRAAQDIQRSLEHFRIPRAIRSRTGKDNIGPIFRDKDDLSITSDLNDTICQALQNSDHLIVICSPEAKESAWVQKEIEFFLETHTRADILTVVTDGEPIDVIPEILRLEETEYIDRDGTVRTAILEREPLCCDWRMKKSRAKREELPRLAAAILGCSYDDLRQRQRQYKTRRLTALAAFLIVVLSALTTYFAWSAGQIRQNYERALINQSQYLAAESQSHLASGDRLTAMLLSLEALPKGEEDDRPVVPAAIDSLVQASYAYVSPGTNAHALQHAFTHTGTVDQILANADGSRLCTVSGLYCVEIWDTASRQSVYSRKFDSGIEDIVQDANGNFIVLTGELTCIDPDTGVELWCYTPTASQYATGDIACAKEDALCVFSTASGVVVLDTDTGNMTAEYSAQDAAGRAIFCRKAAISDDGRHIAASSLSEDTILVWDTQNGTSKTLANPMVYVRDMTFAQDGTLFATVSTTMSLNVTYGEESYLMRRQEAVLKISPQGRILFESPYAHAQNSYIETVFPMRYEDTAGKVYEAIVSVSGNCCHVFDQKNGQLLRRIEFPAPILSVKAEDLQITAVLQDGQRASFHCANGIVKTTPCFVSNLRGAVLCDGCIFVHVENEASVLLYRTGIYDAAWNCVCPEGVSEYAQLDDTLLCLTEGNCLILYDNLGAPLWQVPLAMEECITVDIIGQCGDTAVLNVYGMQEGSTVYATLIGLLDLSTGAQEYLGVDSTAKHFVLSGDQMYYTVEQDGSCMVGMFRVASRKLQIVELEEMMAPNGLFVQDDTIIVTTHDGETYLADKNGACTLLLTAQTPPDTPLVCFGEKGEFAVLCDDAMHVFDKNGEELCAVPLNGSTVRAASIHDGMLFFAANDEKLYCHDAKTGEFLHRTDVIGAEFAATQVSWQWKEDTFSLRLGNGLNLIDSDTFTAYTRVENCIAHFTQNDLVFTLGQNSGGYNRVGTFTLYDLPTLIARANDQLGGLTLTPQQRAAFGVTE